MHASFEYKGLYCVPLHELRFYFFFYLHVVCVGICLCFLLFSTNFLIYIYIMVDLLCGLIIRMELFWGVTVLQCGPSKYSYILSNFKPIRKVCPLRGATCVTRYNVNARRILSKATRWRRDSSIVKW